MGGYAWAYMESRFSRVKRKVGTSTRVTLAVLAALLLLANACPRQTSRGFSYGWPFEMGFEMTFNRLMRRSEWIQVNSTLHVNPFSVFLNIVCVVALVFGLGLLAEWTARLVRRHKGMLRLHLSTLMVLVMVAALLAGANATERGVNSTSDGSISITGDISFIPYHGLFSSYGIPCGVEVSDSLALSSLKWGINLGFACAVLGLIGWRLEKRARKGQGASPGRERAESDAVR